jgi:lipocalin-like protein
MKSVLRYAVYAVLSVLLAGTANADPIPPQLIGTWRLVSNTLEEVASGRKTDLMGKDPIGFISYGADGRMMILQVRSDRVKPQGPVPTPSEAEALFKSFLGYAGTYSISGNTITHHVDLSWNQAWTGTDQVRTFSFDGNRVTLATEASADPIHGIVGVRRLVWEKVN